MTTISFPISISEMTKMWEDGDYVSLSFSYGCIGCVALAGILFLVGALSSCRTFTTLTIISSSLAVMCVFIVYIYRPIFLSDDKRREKGLKRVRRKKYKELDKLTGIEYEEAIAKLQDEELNDYLDDLKQTRNDK